jgi:hypothetical protein
MARLRLRHTLIAASICAIGTFCASVSGAGWFMGSSQGSGPGRRPKGRNPQGQTCCRISGGSMRQGRG